MPGGNRADHPHDSGSEAVAALASQYLTAQLVGDRRAALKVLLDQGVGGGVPVPELYLEVIQAAQHQIGRLWQENRITVAQEHLATAISQLALAHLYPLLPREPHNGKHVLVACVDGELHDIGARVVADFLEMAGFDVRYLGASVPIPSLIGMARESPPDLLALSVTMTFNLPALRTTVWQAREAAGDGLHLAAGGHALRWASGLAAQLGVEIAASDAVEMVATARRALGVEITT